MSKDNIAELQALASLKLIDPVIEVQPKAEVKFSLADNVKAIITRPNYFPVLSENNVFLSSLLSVLENKLSSEELITVPERVIIDEAFVLAQEPRFKLTYDKVKKK